MLPLNICAKGATFHFRHRRADIGSRCRRCFLDPAGDDIRRRMSLSQIMFEASDSDLRCLQPSVSIRGARLRAGLARSSFCAVEPQIPRPARVGCESSHDAARIAQELHDPKNGSCKDVGDDRLEDEVGSPRNLNDEVRISHRHRVRSLDLRAGVRSMKRISDDAKGAAI